MRKLPKFVTVFGRKIPVICIPSAEIIKTFPEFTQAPHGLWDASNRKIYINSELELIDQHYTLKHEMGHSAMTFTGLDLIIPPEIQEIIVQTMATLLEDALNQGRNLK